MALTDSADENESVPEDGRHDDLTLTAEDMCDLLAGKASEEVKRRYAEQIEDPDSFANRWMDEMHTKLSNPFGFSLRRAMNVQGNKEKREKE